MKVLIYRLLSVVAAMILSACQEEKVPVYMDRDRVNFVGTNKYNEDDPDYMYLEKNFLAEKGDACVYILQVKLQGCPSNAERRVYFTERDSTSPGVNMEFGECIIPAGVLRGECRVSIDRPVGNEEQISLLEIDYERSDFAPGTYERQKFMIKVFDRISYELLGIYDGFWEDNVIDQTLGAWSFAKAAFICRTLGITDFSEWFDDPEHWSVDWNAYEFECYDKETLVRALEEYKAEPENPPLYDETKLPEKEWISFETE